MKSDIIRTDIAAIFAVDAILIIMGFSIPSFERSHSLPRKLFAAIQKKQRAQSGTPYTISYCLTSSIIPRAVNAVPHSRGVI